MSKNKVKPVSITVHETSNTSEERQKWGKKLEFLMSCIGYAVGLGNIWRFPYLCFKNGGASFLIPYFLTLITCGIPLFYLELALGQYLSLGPVKAWAVVCPVLKRRYILAMSNGIDEPGQIRWPLAICLLFAWTAVFCCLHKGIKSSGKVWIDAASQIFFSLSVGLGGLVTFASYNKFHNNCERDAVVVATINCLTSFFGGFVIFSVIGFMAHSLNKEVSEVISSGPGLGFVAYPEGIAQMPAASVWAVVFFFMLFTIGMGSQGGIYVLNIFDSQSGGLSLMFVVIFEAVAVSWGYGVDKFCENIKSMIGMKPNMYFIICWKYITPIVGMFIFLGSLTQWKRISFDGNVYPDWAQAVAWLLALLSFLAIPIGAIVTIVHPKGSFRERLRRAVRPDISYLNMVVEQHNLGPKSKCVEACTRIDIDPVVWDENIPESTV
ncbi:hypothetical protein ACROYT_G043748 [Oculina patagonica]